MTIGIKISNRSQEYEWCNKWMHPPKPIRISETVTVAIKNMVAQRTVVLPVVDNTGIYRGIVRASGIMTVGALPRVMFISNIDEVPDLMREYEYFLRTSSDIMVGDIMEENDTIIVSDGMSCSQLFYLFTKHGHEHLFVLNKKCNIVGVVTIYDMLKLTDEK